jgi:16S rRNA (uracil1498-N3)-methyltransferase
VNARFYAPDAHAPGDLVELPDEEAQHLTRVLRLSVGAAIRVFNGRGAEFVATVDVAGKHEVRVRLGEPATPAREARVAITLVQAVLKGDKMDDVVRDAVMLGVAAIEPVITTRSETSRAALERSRRRERWTRIAQAAAKQCGRAVVPAIGEPRAFSDIPPALGSLSLPAPALMLVEPAASAEAVAFGDLDLAPPHEATLIVGPEGGWTADEVALGATCCRLVSLGGRTLRADAMALVAVSAAYAVWKEF